MLENNDTSTIQVKSLVRAVVATGTALAFFILLQPGSAGATAQPAARLQATVAATTAITPAPTLDPAGFDFSTATTIKSTDDVIELAVPTGWNVTQYTVNPGKSEFLVRYGSPELSLVFTGSVLVYVNVGSAAEIYKLGGNPTVVPTSPDSALKALIISVTKSTPQPDQRSYSMSDVHPAKVGKLNGYELSLVNPATDKLPEGHAILRLAALPNGLAVMIEASADGVVWAQVEPLIGKIFDSLIIKSENFVPETPAPTKAPTTTPTP